MIEQIPALVRLTTPDAEIEHATGVTDLSTA
jgi:hypothetical protein